MGHHGASAMRIVPLALTAALVSACTGPAPTSQRSPSGVGASAATNERAPSATVVLVPTASSPLGVDAGEPLPPTEAALTAVMRRAPEPWKGACYGSTFTKFHVWNQTSPLEELYAAVWMTQGEHAIPPMSVDDPRAEHARCIAIGPHTAFNPMNWCCR